MEEKVFLCGWKKSENGFRLWLKEEPFSKAEALSIPQAVENLIETVKSASGVVTPVFEFSPHLPYGETEHQFYEPEILVLTGDEWFETEEPRLTAFALPEAREAKQRWFEQFFSGPSCRKCKIPSGQRNERLLQIRHPSSAYDAGFAYLGCASISLFSSRFLELLTNAERKSLYFLPIESSGRLQKRFFELTGPKGPPIVAADGIKATGWKCPECGRSLFSYFSENLSCRSFVARTDLPSPMPEIFTIGPIWDLNLCVTSKRWHKMIGKKGTRGILSTPLGVLPDNLVVRKPDLMVLD